jgi:hypothetical protein
MEMYHICTKYKNVKYKQMNTQQTESENEKVRKNSIFIPLIYCRSAVFDSTSVKLTAAVGVIFTRTVSESADLVAKMD